MTDISPWVLSKVYTRGEDGKLLLRSSQVSRFALSRIASHSRAAIAGLASHSLRIARYRCRNALLAGGMYAALAVHRRQR